MLIWRRCAIGVPSSQRFGLITQNGAVNEPPKKIDPLSRTARSISDSRSGPGPARTGRAGVSANEGGVPVIVDMARAADNPFSLAVGLGGFGMPAVTIEQFPTQGA